MISEKDFLSRMGVTEPRNFMSLVANCLKTKGCVGSAHQGGLGQGYHEFSGRHRGPGDAGADHCRRADRPKGINRVAVTDPVADPAQLQLVLSKRLNRPDVTLPG